MTTPDTAAAPSSKRIIAGADHGGWKLKNVLVEHLRAENFNFDYLEVDGDHGSMVPMVWPAIFDFFNRHR